MSSEDTLSALFGEGTDENSYMEFLDTVEHTYGIAARKFVNAHTDATDGEFYFSDHFLQLAFEEVVSRRA